jgi:hypothetical protein
MIVPPRLDKEETMGIVSKAAMLAALGCITGAAVAKDMYVLRDEHPETGSNINRYVLMWPVPPEARYEELTPDQQRMVKAEYVTLGASDEPAYPAYGMAPLLREVLKLTKSNAVPDGLVHLAVRVDASGQPRGIGVLSSPETGLTRAIGFALMQTRFKPARCGGNPCDSDYAFSYRFERQNPRNFLVHDWAPVFWLAPLPH